MQINVHWRNWPMSENNKPRTQSTDIKQGKKSNSFFMHLDKNKNHQINWQTPKILDKEKILQKSQYINAFRNEKLINLEDGKPINLS